MHIRLIDPSDRNEARAIVKGEDHDGCENARQHHRT